MLQFADVLHVSRVRNFWSPSSPKFDIFRQKWAKKGHFFAKNRFFALLWTGNDPPPPYFEGAQYKRTRLRNKQVHTDQFLEPVFAKI